MGRKQEGWFRFEIQQLLMFNQITSQNFLVDSCLAVVSNDSGRQYLEDLVKSQKGRAHPDKQVTKQHQMTY